MNDFLDNLANYHYQKMHNKNGQDRVQKKVDVREDSKSKTLDVQKSYE